MFILKKYLRIRADEGQGQEFWHMERMYKYHLEEQAAVTTEK